MNIVFKGIINATAAVIMAAVFIIIGNEIIVQIAMLVNGVAEKEMLNDDGVWGMISVVCMIPEGVFGAITGVYVVEIISSKI